MTFQIELFAPNAQRVRAFAEAWTQSHSFASAYDARAWLGAMRCSLVSLLEEGEPYFLAVVRDDRGANLVMQKIKASERAKLAAARLVIDAEVQLGKITSQVPKAPRGAAAVPGQPTKKGTLRENGIHPFRAQVAEKLAATPKPVVDKAFERAKSKSVFGVTAELGYRKPFEEGSPDKLSRNLAFLANESIELLERSVQTHKPPHAGSVAEMRNRLARLSVRD